MKTCIKCNETKDLSRFEIHSGTGNHRNTCRDCKNRKAKSISNPVSKELKECFICKKIKPAKEFFKCKTRVDGLDSSCKECRQPRTKDYYQRNSERIKANTKQYYIDNYDEVKKQRSEYVKRKIRTDPLYKLKRNLRNRLYYALKKKSWKKNTHFAQYIGCALEDLKAHIQNQFKDDMTWDNYGQIWDIDHIVPLTYAKNDEEMYKLCHYTNLQPMYTLENRNIKREKISPKDLYKIEQIDNKLANTIVTIEHYLERSCPAKYSFGLFDILGNIKGVIIFTHVLSPSLKNSVINTDKEMIELARVWVDDAAPRNTESFFIGNTIRKLKEELIISFADTAQNHKGIIYQACNFMYLGLTKKTKEYKIKGREGKSSYFKGQTVNDLRNKYGEENIVMVDRSLKHIYLYNNSKDDIVPFLVKEVLPFPK